MAGGGGQFFRRGPKSGRQVFNQNLQAKKKLIGIHLKPLIHLAFSASMLHIQPFRNFCAKKLVREKLNLN